MMENLKGKNKCLKQAGIYSTLVRFFNGIITMEVIVYSAVGFAGSMVGNLAGKLIFDRLDPQKLRRLIYIGMIISGVIMIA